LWLLLLLLLLLLAIALEPMLVNHNSVSHMPVLVNRSAPGLYLSWIV
jgi:hypothetical protein